MDNGKWTGIVGFGNCDDPNADRGAKFQLLVVTVDEQANAAFEKYKPSDEMKSLPQGTEVHARITVTRQ